MKNKKLIIISILLLILLGGGLSVFRFVQAEDEYRDEDRNEDEDEDEDDEDDNKDESIAKPRTYQKTIIISPAKIVTEQQIQTVSLPDRDRDGIIDDEDLHPDIAEIYIVQDENLNGIVDTFEYGN